LVCVAAAAASEGWVAAGEGSLLRWVRLARVWGLKTKEQQQTHKRFQVLAVRMLKQTQVQFGQSA
jgi:hypothetical protein